MNISESTTETIAYFKEPKPAVIRIWHWLAFVFFAASLTTVLLNATVFKPRLNVGMVIETVQKEGGIITEKQAKSVAHEYGDKLWDIHKYIGFGLCFLLLWRIVAEISISKEKKLATRIRKALRSEPSAEQRHYTIVQFSYTLFYILFLTMASTGLIMAFEDVEWLKPIHHGAKEIHAFVQYLMYTFMVLHIGGVIKADLTRYGGIVSRMISGNKPT